MREKRKKKTKRGEILEIKSSVKVGTDRQGWNKGSGHVFFFYLFNASLMTVF